jgi:hypothetical protein
LPIEIFAQPGKCCVPNFAEMSGAKPSGDLERLDDALDHLLGVGE